MFPIFNKRARHGGAASSSSSTKRTGLFASLSPPLVTCMLFMLDFSELAGVARTCRLWSRLQTTSHVLWRRVVVRCRGSARWMNLHEFRRSPNLADTLAAKQLALFLTKHRDEVVPAVQSITLFRVRLSWAPTPTTWRCRDLFEVLQQLAPPALKELTCLVCDLRASLSGSVADLLDVTGPELLLPSLRRLNLYGTSLAFASVRAWLAKDERVVRTGGARLVRCHAEPTTPDRKMEKPPRGLRCPSHLVTDCGCCGTPFVVVPDSQSGRKVVGCSTLESARCVMQPRRGAMLACPGCLKVCCFQCWTMSECAVCVHYYPQQRPPTHACRTHSLCLVCDADFKRNRVCCAGCGLVQMLSPREAAAARGDMAECDMGCGLVYCRSCYDSGGRGYCDVCDSLVCPSDTCRWKHQQECLAGDTGFKSPGSVCDPAVWSAIQTVRVAPA